MAPWPWNQLIAAYCQSILITVIDLNGFFETKLWFTFTFIKISGMLKDWPHLRISFILESGNKINRLVYLKLSYHSRLCILRHYFKKVATIKTFIHKKKNCLSSMLFMTINLLSIAMSLNVHIILKIDLYYIYKGQSNCPKSMYMPTQ